MMPLYLLYLDATDSQKYGNIEAVKGEGDRSLERVPDLVIWRKLSDGN